MKHTEQETVTLNMALFQAERIETAFGRIGDIASALRSIINEARRKDAQASEKAPDDALIPVTVKLTSKQARTILTVYKQWLDAPTDRDIYMLVNKAINESA
jgi:ribosomal protein L17